MSAAATRKRLLARVGPVFSSMLLTGSRVVSALVVNKIIATYLGPGGLALVGQFQNFTAMVFGLTSGNVSNAIISSVAGAEDDDSRRKAISSAVACMAGATAVVAIVIAVNASELSQSIFDSPDLAAVLWILALLMVPLMLNVVLLAVAAGLGRTRAFTVVNVLIALASMPVCWVMVESQGLRGAVLSAIVVNSAALCLSLGWMILRSPCPVRWRFAGVDPDAARRLLRLALMTLSTIVGVPLAQFAVRRFVLDQSGVDIAGYWQAALKIGEILLMVSTLMVSLHFLPRFAAGRQGLKRITFRAVAGSLGFLAIVGAAAVLAANVLLPILFSREFIGAKPLLPTQVAGDVLRSGAIVVQAAFLSRMAVRSYIAIDIVYVMCMVGAGYLLVPRLGAQGAAVSVLLASLAALVLALLLLKARRGAIWED